MVMSTNPLYSGVGARNEYFNLYTATDPVTIEANNGDDFIWGSTAGDLISGQGGADVIWSGSGDDVVFGDWTADDAGYLFGAGDFIVSGGGADTVYAGVGDDYVNGCEGEDEIEGGEGKDTLFGGAGMDVLGGGAGNDILYGAAADVLPSIVMSTQWDGVTGLAESSTHSSSGGSISNTEVVADKLYGGKGNDKAYGQGGDDRLFGQEGNDWLVGGAGADILSGGSGLDRFVFEAASDSTGQSQDRIADYSKADGDLVHLAAIDADSGTAGNQAFAFIGSSAFGGTAGELRLKLMGGDTYVLGDTDGDATADFSIKLTGEHALAASDFML